MRAQAGLLPIVIVSTLGYQLSGWAHLAWPGYVALVLYLLCEWPRMAVIPRSILVAAAAVLLVFLWRADELAAGLFQGFNRAVWFATFLAALSYLREAAETSRLVRQCGRVIINQPPSRRYATLSTGALMIGVLLNMAVLNLLGVMARRANTLASAGGSLAVQEARTRRMFTAITRGFSASPVGSPLTMTMAVILAVLPDLKWWRLWSMGLSIAVLLMVLGALLDRASAPRHLVGVAPPPDANKVPGHPVLKFLLLVSAVFLTAVLLEQWLHKSLPLAVLLVAPCASLVWLVAQYWRRGGGRAIPMALARLGRRAPQQFSALRAEIAVLSAGALMGTLIAALLPTAAFADLLAGAGLHGVSVALLVLLMMVALPQVGLNPMLVATLLLASMAQPAAFGLSAELLALSVASGWALAVTCAPVATTVLISCQIARVSPQTLGWRWNGGYVVWGLVVCMVWIAVLAWLGV